MNDVVPSKAREYFAHARGRNACLADETAFAGGAVEEEIDHRDEINSQVCVER